MVLLDEARSDGELTTRTRSPTNFATVWVGLITVAYAAVSLRWITGPVGLSQDGENLGVFAMGSRAMRDIGIANSRGGSVLALGNGSYAHHPPLLVWSTYLSEAAFGVHPWTARLPTACAAVAVIWLLYGLLRDLRLGSWPAAIGVTVAVASPIFLIYGWMSDTPMLALPFALAIARWWVRVGRDDLPLPVPTTVVVVTTLGALAGWEFSWWCAVFVVAAIWGRQHTPSRLAFSRLIGGGVVLGLAVTAGWVAASPTGMHGLIDAFSTRTGLGATTNVDTALRDNLTFAARLTVPLALALLPFAVWLAARDRRSRQLLLLTAIGFGGYAAIFWQASSLHDYWNEWSVVPVAIAFAAAAAAAIGHAQRRHWSYPVGAVVAVAMACAVWGPLMPSEAQAQLTNGARIGRELAATTLPSDQGAWLVSGLPVPEAWVSYVSGRPFQAVDTPAALAHVAVMHPNWWIIAVCGDRCVAMSQGGRRVENVVINRVDVIAAALVAPAPTR